MDEPTDGLHLIDIQQSLQLFNRMVEEGNSLILLEHHIDVIKSADWLIELGPEGGEMADSFFLQEPQQIC